MSYPQLQKRKKRKGKLGIDSNQLSYAMMRSMYGRGQIDEAQGGFLLNYILERMPRKVKKFIKNHGQEQIITYRICRKPVESTVKKLANILTFGKLKKAMKRLNYDDVYHLSLIITLKGGRMFRLEKNARVDINEVSSLDSDCKLLSGDRSKTVAELFTNAISKGLVWRYSAHEFNCQRFIIQLLEPSVKISPKHRKFILQDAGSLLKGKIQRTGVKKLTDLGGIVDTVVKGGEKPSHHMKAYGMINNQSHIDPHLRGFRI